MREQLSKMTLRQLSLWLMVMLDPAYKRLHADQSAIPQESQYPKSVECILSKSITIFYRLLGADLGHLHEDVVAVLDAAHHVTAIPSGQAWIGRSVYNVMLSLELLLDTFIVDRRPNSDGSRSEVDEKMNKTALQQIDIAMNYIAQEKRTEAYYQHLSALGAKLNAMETLVDASPFGQPIPSDVVESTLRGTYFDEDWRKTNP